MVSKVVPFLRRVLGVGLAWASLWVAFWVLVGLTIRIVDPDSLDPGEGTMAALVLGSMGLLSGVAFGTLLSIGDRDRDNIDPPVTRVTGSGILACAIVQLAYLNHGDIGLAAKIKMALLFCAFGGVVTMVWLGMARNSSKRRSSRLSSS